MKTTFFPRLQKLEELEDWIDQSKKQLEFFLEELSEPERDKLDMSTESIQWLGEYLCKRFSYENAAGNEKDIRILNSIGYYVGETFIKHFGGKWFVELDSNIAYCGEPSIVEYNSKGVVIPVYPRIWITVTIGRPEANFILERFENHLKKMRKEI